MSRLLDGWIPPQPTASSVRGIASELVTDRAETADFWDNIRDASPSTRNYRDSIEAVWPFFVAHDDDD